MSIRGSSKDSDKGKTYIKMVLASLAEIEMSIKRRRMEQDMETARLSRT